MTQTVLILGAGIYQVPLIIKAKQLGYRVVVCSIAGNYPGFKLADAVYYVNTTDKEACLDVAIKEKIVAVCTTGTDVALPALGYIVDQMGLNGPSEKSAILSSNKKLMKEAFVNNGVSTAVFKEVCDIESCKLAANEIGYPCILKVVDSSGSRGIEIVHSKNDVLGAYERIQKFTHEPYILVEKYLQGLELGAQALVYDGNVLFSLTHSDEIFMGSTGVPIGHSVPFVDEQYCDLDSKIKDEVCKAVKALGINNSAVNADFIVVDGVPYVLEIGARCGATCLPELVSIYYGMDYYEAIIRTATGTLDINCFSNQNEHQAATALLITSDHDGLYDGYLPNVVHPDLVNCELDCVKGDSIRNFRIGPDRIGQLIVKGSNVEDTKALARELLSRLSTELMKHID